MLSLLIDYAKTHGLTIEPGFKPKTVRWVIICDRNGHFLNVQELGDTNNKNNRGNIFNACPDLSQPEMKAGGTGCRHFLVDNVQVVALMGKNGDVQTDSSLEKEEQKKASDKHDYFVSLLRQGTNGFQDLDNIATLLEATQQLSLVQQAFSNQAFKPTDNVTFAIAGRIPMFLVEDNAWHDWWRGFRQSLQARTARRKGDYTKHPKSQAPFTEHMLCLGSGKLVEPVLTHGKIEGLSDVGGLSMGDVVSAYKQESFCSYFLTQSKNAAVSEEMAAAYRAGLNSLVAHHSKRLTNSKVVHWYKGKDEVPNDLDPLGWLIETENVDTQERDAQNRARTLFDSIRSGMRSDLLGYCYYSLTLSGASGRVMIRDWIEGQFGELVSNIDDWFDDLSIVRRDGWKLTTRPKFLAVLGALVRELKELPPSAEAKLWRAAVQNEPIPDFAMAQALARLKIDIINDEPLNHARIALLKAYHIRKGDQSMQPYLNEEHPNPAYHCGRLMAVYADLQRAALGDVGAGVVQRYYAAASATPALILGRLSRGSQFHLSKLKGALAHLYEQRLASIWGRISDELPKTLALEEQSLFALGYYQQIASRIPTIENIPLETSETKGDLS